MKLSELNRLAIKSVLFRFTLFGLPLVLLSYWGLTLVYQSRLETLLTDREKQQEELVLLDEFYFENMFALIYGDITVVMNSDELQRYVLEPSDLNWSEAGEMFLRFLRGKRNIIQLQFVAPDGKVLLGVTKRGEGIYVTDRESLPDLGGTSYFQILRRTADGQMGLSDFQLQRDGGEIVLPYRPVISFGLPVGGMESRYGYLIADVDGLGSIEFLKNSELKMNADYELGLIDGRRYISSESVRTEESLGAAFLENPLWLADIFDEIDFARDRHRFTSDGRSYFYRLLGMGNSDWSILFDGSDTRWLILSSFDIGELLFSEGGLFIRFPFLRAVAVSLFALIILVILIFFRVRESEHLLFLASGIITDFSHDGIMITDDRKRVLYCNPLFEDLYGYSLTELKGKNPRELLSGSPPISFGKEKGQDYIVWEGNIWDVSRDRVHIQRYLRLRSVDSADRNTSYFIGIYSEPKLRSRPEDERNPATLLNRETVDYFAPQLFRCNPPVGGMTAVAILRISEFAILRNRLTENEESTLISTLSSTIMKSLGSETIIFAPTSGLLFLAVSLREDFPVENVMDSIDRAVSSISFSDPGCRIQYLAGVALSPEHGEDGETLIECASMALEAVSRYRAVKYLLYDGSIRDMVSQYHRIKNEIETAYEEDEFSLVYQPQNNAETGRITGVEALVRWESRRLGSVSPARFIPIMEEEPTQIKRLGKHILSKVIGECGVLLPLISEDFRVSVNLSAQEFADPALISELIQIVCDSEFPARNICFEITETILSENLNKTNRVIGKIHEREITVAIDDFGTGYSSLGYLRKLESDKLKVDRMFIKDYPGQDDGSILSAIVKLARELGMKVIVEGIETREQLAFVRSLGCEEFQGYLFSRPVVIGEIVAMLEKERPQA